MVWIGQGNLLQGDGVGPCVLEKVSEKRTVDAGKGMGGWGHGQSEGMEKRQQR